MTPTLKDHEDYCKEAHKILDRIKKYPKNSKEWKDAVVEEKALLDNFNERFSNKR